MSEVVAMMSTRIEDYLETIFEIEMEGQLPSITELAARLNLRKATVTVAVQKMTEEGLLIHERYGKIALTRKGLGMALITFRRHTQMTYLFSKLFGIAEDDAERMACAVEHEITPQVDQRIAALVDHVGKAAKDQASWFVQLHQALECPQPITVPLAMTPAHLPGKVASIHCHEQRRSELADLGIVKGATLIRTGDDENLSVLINNGNQVVQLQLQDGVALWIVPCAGETN